MPFLCWAAAGLRGPSFLSSMVWVPFVTGRWEARRRGGERFSGAGGLRLLWERSLCTGYPGRVTEHQGRGLSGSGWTRVSDVLTKHLLFCGDYFSSVSKRLWGETRFTPQKSLAKEAPAVHMRYFFRVLF